jgi:organic hydroperoxide reductase OsmC/OhrA
MSAPPAEFGGPGYRWSPETLFVAAVADCFVLTFGVVSKASRLNWSEISCEAVGRLDRTDGATRFTEIELHVGLAVESESDKERAHVILDKAHKACTVGNSLRCPVIVRANVRTGGLLEVLSHV